MRVDVLHIDECPNWEQLGGLVEELLPALGAVDVHPRFVLISTPEEAAAVPFAGSPTLLIDGVDAYPGATRTTALACRVYREGKRMVPLPSRESVRRVLEKAIAARPA